VPGAATVAVKQALGQAAAISLHPDEAREQLHRVAAKAIRRHDRVPLLTLPGPLKVEIDLYGPYTVDLATLIPGVSRAPGARTVTFTAADMGEAYRLVQLVTQLAQIKPG
jgi:D-amino peptidase